MKELTNNQLRGISQLKDWRVGALFMEPGAGKTRTACELINMTPDVDCVLWLGPLNTIRPKAGIEPVSEEVNKWNTTGIEFKYVGIESLSLSGRTYLDTMEYISKAKALFIVVDESLKIKNSLAKRTKHIIELGRSAKYKLILNGTPISRDLLDLWAQMEFLSPKILNMTLTRFRNTFCIVTTRTTQMPSGYTKREEWVKGYTNIDYLYSLIRNYVFQCDLHLDVDRKHDEVRYFLTDDNRELYNEIKNRYLDMEMLDRLDGNIFFAMTQEMQHCYCVDDNKIEAVKKLFERIPQDKTIIFCKFVKSREVCEKLFPKARVLSYQKEAFGLNLQEYNHTVYFDKIWDWALREQSGRRTYRTGQDKNCYYYDVTGTVGLERMIDSNIAKKIGISDYLKHITIEDLKQEL
jgi:SNF2 family DNA or RNA helicase